MKSDCGLLGVHRPSLWTGSLFWDGVKKSRGEGRKRVRACRQTFEATIPPSFLVIADHLSARSLSVTWIHWNVINFACKKGVGRQHTNFYLAPKCCFFQWVFSALEGLVLNEKMWFLPFISFWEVVTCILIFCGYCFWSAWFARVIALWCKNIHCGSKSSSVNRQKTPCSRSEDVCTREYLNQIAYYVPTKKAM